MASTHIESPTMANPPTGASKKGTWSFWMKRTGLGGSRILNTNENSNNEFLLSFKTDDTMQIYQIAGGSNQYQYRTNRKFRDINSWYHIVLAIDTTLGTAGDRVKLYVNGVQETSFQTTTNNMPQNHSFHGLYGGIKQNIGRDVDHGSEFFDGVLSYFAFIDGTQELPTIFGETDSTTGEWKIKTTITPSSAWGTNGYLILKDGNSLTDQSTNSNNFSSVAGTLTKTEDCPSNVFATINPLANPNTSGLTLSNGNNTLATASGGHDFSISNLGMFSGGGKFYCEVKVSSSADFNMIGISDHYYQGSNQELSEDNYSYGYYSDSGAGSTGGVVRGNGSNILSSMPNYTAGDIIGIAVDLENHKLYFHKNGTYINSGDPTSGSTGTGAVSINNLNTTPNTDRRGQGAYFFGVGDWTTTSAGTYQCNFGNGYFGTTAVSSAGTNASNNGIFEYNVPAGYTALSTKGLNL